MKKIHTIYISLLILLSFLIIITNTPSLSNLSSPVSNIVNNKIAYLTFDDGPSENTNKILNILDKYQIKATFFVVGPSYKLKNDLLNNIVSKGHKLAIHSYNHEYSKIYENDMSYIKDFYECFNWIKKTTGEVPHIYRFPGGSSNTIAKKKDILKIIEKLDQDGFYHVDWNVDSFDSHYNTDPQAIIKTTLNYIKINESNDKFTQTILFHDNKKKVATIEALPKIIESLMSKKYIFATLNETSPLIQHIKKPA